MAHINGEFEHEKYEIIIEVLEPEKYEKSFEKGLAIKVDWDMFSYMPLKDFRQVIGWMNERSIYIENNFTKNGKLKKIKNVK